MPFKPHAFAKFLKISSQLRFIKSFVSISVKIFLLRLNTVYEQKYPDIRSLLLLILKSLDGDFLCNSSKIESTSSSCEDNIVGLSSTAIESDAFEELAQIAQTLGGEISTLEVLLNSSSSNWL